MDEEMQTVNKALLQTLNLSSEQLADFCRRWKITELAVFGSALREDFSPESDIDLLVSFAPNAQHGLLNLVRMERELETVIGRGVDLMTKRAVEKSHNWIRRRNILSSATPIFKQGTHEEG